MKRLKLIFLALLVLLAACAQPAVKPPTKVPKVAALTASCGDYSDNRAYVNTLASGANDGTTWADAFTNLQSALAAANTCPNISQIWVAKGTYYPDEGGTFADNDRLAYFGMKNNLGIYGGFAGGETQLSQRDWKNTTTLSGEIQQDNNSGNNSLNVVANFYSNASRLYNTAILDGFTITGGNANGSRFVSYFDYSLDLGIFGGGMINYYASPTVVNCIFTGNTAQYGGGIANYYSFDSLKIENTSFYNNSAQQGGGIYLFQFSGSTSGDQFSGVLSNVNVSDNLATKYGGGIMIADSRVAMQNMVVANNSAQGVTEGIGGGILSYGSNVILTNGTFFGNSATVRGGGIAFSQDLPIFLTIKNSIFWGNRAGANAISSITGTGSDFPSGTTATYSNIERSSGVFTGTGNINQDPLFLSPANPKGSDNTWLTADDGLRLQSGSPSINSGTNTGAPSADIIGTPRPLSAANPADMGAYEFQAISCLPGFYSNGSSCVAASPGYFVANAGATAQTPCALGSYQPASGAVSCIAADAGNFVDTTGAVAQTQCPAGRYQPAIGQSSCLDAAPGNFVATSGATQQTQCAVGTYQPDPGKSSCILASPGNFVNVLGATTQTPCPAGRYQPASGAQNCIVTPPGSYVSAPGAIQPTQCLAGSYQPLAGQTSCIAALPGSFVANPGATAQIPCAAGTYQPNSGAISCIQASAGFYVPNAGATAQLQCPSGTTSTAGATTCTPITPTYSFSGFFQPVDNLPTLNLVKAGSSIPVKFSLNGNQGLNILAAGYPTSQPIACSSSAPLDDIEQTVNAGGSSLSYEASSDSYTYVWKTDKSWAGTCRQLNLRLSDGTSHIANFKFK